MVLEETRNSTKTCILGIQGSGKTEVAKFLASLHKKPMWYLVHLDDMEEMPSSVRTVVGDDKDYKELDKLCKVAIDYAKQDKIDCLIIDETDMFLNGNVRLSKHLNDLVINHRHYGVSVVFISRRPQEIPTKIIENCEHLLIFALNNSTNINRKLDAIDRSLLPMLPYLNKDKHNFIYKRLGHKPKLFKPIDLDKLNTVTFAKNDNVIKIEELLEEHRSEVQSASLNIKEIKGES